MQGPPPRESGFLQISMKQNPISESEIIPEDKKQKGFLIFRKKEIPKREDGAREKRRNAIVRDSR